MSITLFTSIGPVKVKEMYEDYSAGMDIQRGPFVNKSYLCPSWTSAFPVVNALMGSGSRPIQHACPESPNLRCMSAVIQPRGEYDAKDGGRPQFNMPVVKCQYAVPTWEALTSDDPTAAQSFPNAEEPGQPYTFMEQSIDWDTEVVKLPGRAYTFETDGMVTDTPIARTIAVAQFVLVRRWQTTLPYANVTSYLKAPVNSATFLGQAPGYVKFRKARTRRQMQTDGTRSQEVEYVFQWREAPHGWALRPDTGAFDQLVGAGGVPVYASSDLNGLLS